MNRAERRRQQKAAAKNPTYNIPESVIRDKAQVVFNEMREDLISEYTHVITAVAMNVLNSEFGMGEVRLKRFMGRVNYTLDAIQSGHVNFKEMSEWIRDEFDIDLTIGGKKDDKSK